MGRVRARRSDRRLDVATQRVHRRRAAGGRCERHAERRRATDRRRAAHHHRLDRLRHVFDRAQCHVDFFARQLALIEHLDAAVAPAQREPAAHRFAFLPSSWSSASRIAPPDPVAELLVELALELLAALRQREARRERERARAVDLELRLRDRSAHARHLDDPRAAVRLFLGLPGERREYLLVERDPARQVEALIGQPDGAAEFELVARIAQHHRIGARATATHREAVP